ncbi:hypothetical protein T07_7740 [Trichinella nelsoni]|uniref:Uncharacterized protein n=1 Tax=Trichinella nelsoni TaxID=6336 RepID=A0A0V0SCN3_9BILA|nr:hypothetical protein T07_7740 [Trichinella nelsoni]
MPSGKRETERKGNPPVNTSPSPNSDEHANNTVVETANTINANLLTVVGTVENRQELMLVNSGSAVTLLRRDAYDSIDNPSPLNPSRRLLLAVNGTAINVLGVYEVRFRLGAAELGHLVHVVSNVSQRCLLSADFLSRHGCVLNFALGTLICGEAVVRFNQTLGTARFVSRLGGIVTDDADHQPQATTKKDGAVMSTSPRRTNPCWK